MVLAAAEANITVLLSFSGLSGNAVAGHIHGPAPAGMNAAVLFNLSPPAASSGAIVPQTFAVTSQQVSDLKAGLWYFNVHTAAFPGGEIRGQIGGAKTYTAALAGSQEVPPNASAATGYGVVVLSTAETTIAITARFAGLGTNASAGHIHGPAAPGSNAPVIFPLSPPAATSGDVPVATFAMTPTQVLDLKNGLHYFNIHSTGFPGGEIRGQILTTIVPVELMGFSVE